MIEHSSQLGGEYTISLAGTSALFMMFGLVKILGMCRPLSNLLQVFGQC